MSDEPLPPLPAGLPGDWLPRRPVPGDARAVHALCVAYEEALLPAADLSLADVAADLAAPTADAGRNQAVVFDGDHALAWAHLSDRTAGHTVVDLYVAPTLDAVVADTLADWCWSVLLDRAAAVARERGVPVTLVDTGTVDGDAAAAGRLAERGFRRVRTFWRMARDVDASESLAGTDGVVVRPVASGGAAFDADLITMHRIHEESFADHWNFHPTTLDEWWGRYRTSAGLDLGLWWLAEVDGVPGGFAVATMQMADEGALYVDSLGTARSARRRGVATALLRHSFGAAVQRGMSSVRLNVDSENPTGATKVYESAGMRVEFAMHGWQRDVAAAAS
jgi:mycothiol synthase